jgi:hypothetical protein
MHIGLHAKCILLLSEGKQNWNISTNFAKIYSVALELLYAGTGIVSMSVLQLFIVYVPIMSDCHPIL